jgi:hypothetical protein
MILFEKSLEGLDLLSQGGKMIRLMPLARRLGYFSAASTFLISAAVPIRADSVAQQEQLKQEVDAFASNAIAHSREDASLARWSVKVCPFVAGLNNEQREFILTRLSHVARDAGVPLDDAKCNANLFVVFSNDPEPGLMRLANHHDANAFNGETKAQLNAFVGTRRPVRAWYNVGKRSVEGVTLVAAILDPASGAARHFSAPQGLDPVYNRVSPQLNSHLKDAWVSQDILSVIVVVDASQVRQLNFGQLSDYIGMLGLAQINLDNDLGAAPTILNVFKDSDGSRPQEMTAWDKALLHALYSAPQDSKRQLTEMQTEALNEITSKAAN